MGKVWYTLERDHVLCRDSHRKAMPSTSGTPEHETRFCHTYLAMRLQSRKWVDSWFWPSQKSDARVSILWTTSRYVNCIVPWQTHRSLNIIIVFGWIGTIGLQRWRSRNYLPSDVISCPVCIRTKLKFSALCIYQTSTLHFWLAVEFGGGTEEQFRQKPAETKKTTALLATGAVRCNSVYRAR